MLFLVFTLGSDRFALAARCVVEVLPLLELKQLPRAPHGVVGVFNYRGRPVPAVDLSVLALGLPAQERLSTRIIVINYADAAGVNHLLGLIAEHATGTMRKDAVDFADTGLRIRAAPYLGPILMDPGGAVQWIDERRLLPEPASTWLFAEVVSVANEKN